MYTFSNPNRHFDTLTKESTPGDRVFLRGIIGIVLAGNTSLHGIFASIAIRSVGLLFHLNQFCKSL